VTPVIVKKKDISRARKERTNATATFGKKDVKEPKISDCVKGKAPAGGGLKEKKDPRW